MWTQSDAGNKRHPELSALDEVQKVVGFDVGTALGDKLGAFVG